VAGAGRAGRAVRRERRTLLVALSASVLFHLGLFLWVRALPAPVVRHTQAPLSFTLLERPAPPPPSHAPPPPKKAALGGASASGPASATGSVGRSGQEAPLLKPDIPFAKDAQAPALAQAPSLKEMSEKAAEAVVTRRGPSHAPKDTVGDRLAETLQRGTHERALQRNGFWDGYFTELKKALLAAWSAGRAESTAQSKETTRVRLIIDAEGLLLDFDIIIKSGNSAMDFELEQTLHATAHLPPPPEHVLNGKTELVTEWEFTVHPGLAQKQGETTFNKLGFGTVFDLISIANPKVDLTPLERNIVLATYWTR
jgi:periplasmic protein TonB